MKLSKVFFVLMLVSVLTFSCKTDKKEASDAMQEAADDMSEAAEEVAGWRDLVTSSRSRCRRVPARDVRGRQGRPFDHLVASVVDPRRGRPNGTRVSRSMDAAAAQGAAMAVCVVAPTLH